MNRAVVVLLLLIANAIVSFRTAQPPGTSSPSSQGRSRAHSIIVENGRFASPRAPTGKAPGCRTAEDARAATWLRL